MHVGVEEESRYLCIDPIIYPIFLLVSHKPMSESEEMYLVTIARLNESGDNLPVPVSQLAAELNVLPVSANQMIRKLEETGWVCYTPYKGVSLTEEGAALALQILRHRRLWEVFLVEKLKIPVAEAAELACRLEHFLPVDAAERLAIYLGNPGISPSGSPIPQPGIHQPPHPDMPVATLELDQPSRITRIESDLASRTFLAAEGILPNQTVLLEAISSTGAILLKTEDGSCVHLSPALAKFVWVERPR